jgi:chromosomal replication initiator protein
MDYSIFWTGIQNFISEQDVPSMFLTQLQYYSFSEGDKSLTLVTPNDFLKDFILSNYKQTFENILLKCWNQKININIIVDSGYDAVKIEKKESIKQKKIIEEQIAVPPKIQLVEEPKKIEPTANVEKEKITPEAKTTDRVFSDNDEECTFDSFLTDDTNEYAFRLAQTIAEEPGNPKRNPLFLWGESGTGKTHLIKAIKQRAERLFDQKKIIYVTSENFLNEFLDSIRNKKDSEQDKPKIFREKYRKLDILLLDDFQALSGKEACLNELFNTFNELYDKKTQIVITCDQPISKVKDVEKRIKSRFSMGTTVELKQPDYELKMAILKDLAQQNNMNLNLQNIEYICTNISGNIREIKGAFRDLLAYTSIMNIKEITIDVINKCLKSKITAVKSVGNISIDKIMEIVANYYDLTVPDIRGKKRTQSTAIARQIAMYLSTQYTRLSTTQIGKYFNKEHGTIIHAAKKIKKRIDEDKKLKSEVINIENRIKEGI